MGDLRKQRGCTAVVDAGGRTRRVDARVNSGGESRISGRDAGMMIGRSGNSVGRAIRRFRLRGRRWWEEFSGRLLQDDRKWGRGWKWRERVEIAEDRVDSWTPE